MTIRRQPKTPKNYFFKLLFLMNLSGLKVLYKKVAMIKNNHPVRDKNIYQAKYSLMVRLLNRWFEDIANDCIT